MIRRALSYALEPLHHLIHDVEPPPRHRTAEFTIGGVVLAVALVAFGLWIWPEVQRTIRIHRM